MAVEPPQEESCLGAMQKMFPDRDLQALQLAAKWLEDNFGVATEDDLEGAAAWAKMGMSLVVSDASLDMACKGILQGLLLRKLNEADKQAEDVGSANTGYSPQETVPQAHLEAATAEPQAEQTVLARLSQMFPDQSTEALEIAASWLKAKFGVELSSDLDGAELWADKAAEVLAEDSKIDVDAQEILESLFAKLAVVETSPTASEVPLPQDSVVVSLRKMYPDRAAELLEHSGAWLERSFGVATYEDLEGAGAWADMARDLAMTDTTLEDDTKDFLREELLKRLAGVGQELSATVDIPGSGPLPEDSILAALEKMFPEKSLGMMAPVSTWLSEKFGIATYADFDGAEAWAGMALQLVETDSSLSAESKTFLEDLLKKLAGSNTAAISPATESSSSRPGKRSKDDFLIHKTLGEGSFAQVYSVTERSSQKKIRFERDSYQQDG